MNNRIAIILALSMSLCSSLFAQNNVIDTSSIIKLRIDPNLSVGVPSSEIFKRVEYIPLETTKESLFGRISQLEIAGDRYVIYDQDTWTILIFNSSGKFINKISSKNVAENSGMGNSANNGSVFRGFKLITDDGKQYISIQSNRLQLKYDLDGNLVDKIKFAFIPEVITLKDGLKVQRFYTQDQKNYHEVAILKDDKPELYFPFKMSKYQDEELYTQGNLFYLSQDESTGYFIDYYSYDAYEISKKGVSLKYRFLLPQNMALPKDFNTKLYKGKKWETIRTNKQMVYGIHNLFQNGSYLYFSLAEYSQQINDKKTLAYHLPSGRMISLQHIMPDAKSYFLPTNDATSGSFFMEKGFLKYNKDNLYNVISAKSMFKFNEENKEGQKLYPVALKNFFKGTTIDNPVLVKITLIK